MGVALKFLFGFSVIALFAACSDSSDGGEGSDQNTAANAETVKFNGTWTTGCQTDGSGSSATQLVIKDGDVNGSFISYATSDCTDRTLLETKSHYNFAVTGDSSIGSDLLNIAVTMGRQTVKANNQQTVDSFNASSFCGFTRWRVGVEKDISGRSCDGKRVPPLGTKVYSIAQLKDNQLQLGESDDDHGGLSSGERHAVLADRVYTQ